MECKRMKSLEYQVLELDGVRYGVIREQELLELSRSVDVACKPVFQQAKDAGATVDVSLDDEQLAKRLTMRRKRAGLSQAELARNAGVRVETLNRIERGKTTPDFSTIRKLVVAINNAER